MEKEVLSFPLWDPVIRHTRTVQSSAKGGSDWTLGSISLLRGWSNTRIGYQS